MDMSENQENKHHHKRSKHSKHSRSKRKRKHRHHHHHHHHHHSKKKHHKHRSKVKLDERALLSALESLEADALDSIRVEVNKDPESGELLVSGSIQEEEEEVGGVADGSEDSDSSSSESEPEEGQTQTEPEKKIVNTDVVKAEESTIHAMSSRNDPSSIPPVHHFESAYSVSLTNESIPEIFSGNGTQLASGARDSERVEKVERASSSEVVENLALKKDLKTIRINIQRKSLLSDTKETELESDLNGLKVENGQTMTGDTKITYVNLKNEKLTAGSASGDQVGNSERISVRDDMKSGSISEVEFSSESDTERDRQKSRDHSAVKHHKAKSRSRRHGRSRSKSQTRSPQRSRRHEKSRSRSHSKSLKRSRRRERSRSRSQSKSLKRSHRRERSRSKSQSKSPQRSHRCERSRSKSQSHRSRRHGRSRSRSRSKSPQRSHRRDRSRSRSRSKSPHRSHRRERSRSKSQSKLSHRSHRRERSRSRSRSKLSQRSHRRERSRSRSRSKSPHRSHRRERSRSRSRSKLSQRSHRRERSRSRSQSKSPHRSHRRERSRSRSRSKLSQRSHRRERSRSRSRSKSPHRSHRRERSRSRSRSKSPHRSHRRERSRSRSRSKSPQRSHRHGRSRSRSRSRTERRDFRSHSHSRVPYHSRRRDSYYRSPWRHHSSMRKPRRRRSRSRSRHDERSHSRSQSYSKGNSSSSSSRSRSPSEAHTSARDTSSSVAMGTVANATGTASVTGSSDPKKAHIAHLTALCKQLQQKQAIEDEMPPEERKAKEENEDTEEMHIRAPFNVAPTPAYQSGLIFHNNAWKTPNQLVVESNVETENRPVEEKFPVSAGLDHQKTENYMDAQSAAQSINVFARFQPVSVGDLVVKRLEATRTLQENPADFIALQTLAYIEEKAQVWAESHKKLGQFTGQRALTALSKVEHNTGIQAWAKKKMFHGLPPVMSGFGMKMLKKMGWQEGQPLGKMGEGYLEPIAMDVKVDRSGLSTEMDKQPPVVSATALQSTNGKSSHLVHGKHPVSALQEICAKKHWDPPHYELLELGGPAHKKNFLYKVSVPLGTFQPAVASPSKKQAKAQAATACLQGLGFFGDSAVTYTAS